MQRWLAAIGGSLVTIVIVVACAGHAPQTPTPVAQSASGDESGLVRVQETPEPPVFPSVGPTPQTFPSTGPTPETFPSTGPTPETFPSTGPTPETFPSIGPTPQTFPTTGPTPQTYPSTNAPQPTPTPSPTPTVGPTPTPTPSAPTLIVSGLSVATGTPYTIQRTTECCSNGMGRAWLDWPYVLQQNFGTDNANPLYMIRTAVADTNASSDPLIVFTINRCATVHVIFGEDGHSGSAPPYPPWVQAQGFGCSVDPNGGGTVSVFFHETMGPSDQVDGPECIKDFPAGQVALGPRVPTGPSSKLYTVFIESTLADCTPLAGRLRTRNRFNHVRVR